MAKPKEENALPQGKKKTLDALMRGINKKYGAGTISLAGKAVALEVERIPSGSFGLDCELGGGWPRGRISLVAGPFSVGKSFLAYLAVAEAQKKYPNETPIWIDQEGVFEPSWASKFGIIIADPDADEKDVPVNALRVVRPDSAESALDITLEFIDCPGISIIVYDSIAANSPKDEIEASMEDWTMGLAARLNNKFFRKSQAILNIGSLTDTGNKKPAIFMINQLRKTMDKYKPEVLPGGEGQGFFASIIVWLRQGERFLEGRENGQEDEYVGHEIKFKTEKNKTFPPKRQGSFDIYVTDSDTGFRAGQVDRLKEVVSYGIYWGVIRKSAAWFYVDGVEKPFNGGDKMLEFLRTSPEHVAQIEKAVMALALSKVNKQDIGPATYTDEKGRVIRVDTGEVVHDPGDDEEIEAGFDVHGGKDAGLVEHFRD
jgi:recombination protein RecA